MPPKKSPESIIKLACIHDGQLPLLLPFDQTKPLAEIIVGICKGWGIKNPEAYAFKSDDTHMYITEKNRFDLKNGSVLKLAFSPSAQAASFVESISGRDPNARSAALRQLQVETQDATFANKFFESNGLAALMKIINDSRGNPNEITNLGYALSGYNELLQHGVIDIDSVTEQFMNSILVLAKGDKSLVTKSALRITATYTKKSSKGFGLTTRVVPYETVVGHAESSDHAVQEGAVSLLNSLMIAAPAEKQQEVFDALAKRKVIRALGHRVREDKNIQPALAKDLTLFQRLWLNRLEVRRQTLFVASDPECDRKLQTLRKTLPNVSPNDYSTRSSRRGKQDPTTQWSRLGFSSDDSPEQDLQKPPGMLALDCMVYFSQRDHGKAYTQLIIDQCSRPSNYACPFALASISLVDTLFEVLHIGEAYVEGDTNFMPMFFSDQESFNEIFSVAIQLVSRTWTQMDAKQRDFDKVLLVVKKQLLNIFEQPSSQQPRSMDDLKQHLFELSYQRIVALEQEDMRTKEEELLESEPVQELKSQIIGGLTDLVEQQRLANMCDGAWFRPYNKGKPRKDAKFFCILAQNHKTIHWGDPVSSSEGEVPPKPWPTPAQLPNQCSITGIKQHYVGAELPSLQDRARTGRKHDEAARLSFAFIGDTTDGCLEFMSLSKKQVSTWMDGLRVLSKRQMEEIESKQDISHLVSMELRLAILELQGADIPKESPVVPEPPSDFNFHYIGVEESTA